MILQDNWILLFRVNQRLWYYKITEYYCLELTKDYDITRRLDEIIPQPTLDSTPAKYKLQLA